MIRKEQIFLLVVIFILPVITTCNQGFTDRIMDAPAESGIVLVENRCSIDPAQDGRANTAHAFLKNLHTGRTNQLLDCLADDAMWTIPGDQARLDFAGTFTGKVQIRSFLDDFNAAIDIRKIVITALTGSGDNLVIKCRMEGRNRSTKRTLDTEAIHTIVFNSARKITGIVSQLAVDALALSFDAGGKGHIISDISLSMSTIDVINFAMASRDTVLNLPLANFRAMVDTPAPALPADGAYEPVTVAGIDGEFVSSSTADSSKVILHFHGGGFFAYHPAFFRLFNYNISKATHCRVLCIDYRLAPENPFPAGLDDCLAVYAELLQTYTPGKILFMGDSAGGNLVFTVMLKAQQQGLPLPAAAFAFSPGCDLTLASPTLETNRDIDSMLTREFLERVFGYYLQGHPAADPLCSPVFGNLAALPPVYMTVGSTEILFGEITQMFNLLTAAGVRATLEIGAGTLHDYPVLGTEEAQATYQRIGAFVRQVMHRD